MRPSRRDGKGGSIPANKVPTLVGCFCPLTAATIANAVEGFRGPLCRPFNKLRADVTHTLKAIRELTMLGNPRYVRGCDSLLQAAGRGTLTRQGSLVRFSSPG